MLNSKNMSYFAVSRTFFLNYYIILYNIVTDTTLSERPSFQLRKHALDLLKKVIFHLELNNEKWGQPLENVSEYNFVVNLYIISGL